MFIFVWGNLERKTVQSIGTGGVTPPPKVTVKAGIGNSLENILLHTALTAPSAAEYLLGVCERLWCSAVHNIPTVVCASCELQSQPRSGHTCANNIEVSWLSAWRSTIR